MTRKEWGKVRAMVEAINATWHACRREGKSCDVCLETTNVWMKGFEITEGRKTK